MPNWTNNQIEFDTQDELETAIKFMNQLTRADNYYQIIEIQNNQLTIRNLAPNSQNEIISANKLHFDTTGGKAFQVFDGTLSQVSPQINSVYLRTMTKFEPDEYYLSPVANKAQNFIKKLKNEPIFNFRRLIPDTYAIEGNFDPKTHRINQDLNDPQFWFEWRANHWDTKWNASDVYIDHTNAIIEFSTAWQPPFKIFDAFVNKFSNMHLIIRYMNEEDNDWTTIKPIFN